MQRREMNDHTYIEQLQGDDGPIAAIDEFNMAPDDTERFIAAWADDAAYMKQQPGFVSAQLHRGTAVQLARFPAGHMRGLDTLRRPDVSGVRGLGIGGLVTLCACVVRGF